MSDAYRIEVLLNGIPEAVGVALMHEIAQLLVEHELATPEDAIEVRAILALHPHEWTGEPSEPGAIEVLAPKAVPQSPDLGADYSPN